MTLTDYRDALRLIESAIALIQARPSARPRVARHWRHLSLEAALLRVRLAQASPRSRRN